MKGLNDSFILAVIIIYEAIHTSMVSLIQCPNSSRPELCKLCHVLKKFAFRVWKYVLPPFHKKYRRIADTLGYYYADTLPTYSNEQRNRTWVFHPQCPPLTCYILAPNPAKPSYFFFIFLYQYSPYPNAIVCFYAS